MVSQCHLQPGSALAQRLATVPIPPILERHGLSPRVLDDRDRGHRVRRFCALRGYLRLPTGRIRLGPPDQGRQMH